MMLATSSQVLGGGADALERALPQDGKQAVVLANGPSHLSVTLQRDLREHEGVAQVATLDMLYAGSAPVRVRRARARVLELEVAEGYLASAFERVARDPARDPFRAGDVVELPRMRVIVLAVAAKGSPTRVRFELGYDPEPSNVVWLAWLRARPRSVEASRGRRDGRPPRQRRAPLSYERAGFCALARSWTKQPMVPE